MNNIKRHFFPGGNTPLGFYSFYENILFPEEASRIFCLKGGPGTGKSTLMKDIGRYFEDKDYDIDYFWCSSDPDSLDGVVIKEPGVAVIDGTSPHVVDPKTPGAIDEIINLGECWNEEVLRYKKERIIKLNSNISACYDNAYLHLKEAQDKYKIIEENVALTNGEELDTGISSIINSLIKGEKREGKCKSYFGSAITYKGFVNKIDELRNNMEVSIVLNVPVGIRLSHILESIANDLINNGCSITKLYCPMNPNKLEHIILDDRTLAIFTLNEYHKSINTGLKETIAMKVGYDFIKEDLYDIAKDEFEESIENAMDYLVNAKKLHDSLEECYIPAMNFDKVNEIKEKSIFKVESISY